MAGRSRIDISSLEFMSKSELAKCGYFSSEQHELNFHGGPEMTYFSSGRPGEAKLRRFASSLQDAAVRRYTEELSGDCDLLQYGDLKGDPTYRIQLARFLTERYGSPVHSDDLFCTAGASQGLNFIASHIFKTGDLVFVEDPTYFLALTMFRYDLQLNIVPVTNDDSGIDTADLERKLKEHLGDRPPGDTKPFSCLLYLVHCFQNPTGTCTTPERSREIISLARKYDALVVCDDVYNLLSWIPADEGSDKKYKSPPRLFSFDDPGDPDYKGNVVSNGSVSKFLGPGLRLGWLEAPPRVLDMIVKNNYLSSGGSFNHLTSGIIGTMLKMGLVGPHLDYVRDALKASADGMTEVLKAGLPPEVKFRTPQGGYFFWLELPKTVDIGRLDALCRGKYKINFAPGKNFSFGTGFTNCIRLSFSYYPAERLREATEKLCQAIAEVMTSPPAAPTREPSQPAPGMLQA